MSEEVSKARLENWFVGPHDLLYGNVYNHPYFFDGEPVVTSRVVTWDKEKKIAITNNTHYILGEPAK